MKIAIIGHSGSGKSTLADYLGHIYHIPVLYLDTVQFTADWKERDRQEAVSMVQDFMERESWVIDGNYKGFLQDERLAEADQIIFLNFNRINCLVRALKRFFQYRNSTRESMAKDCREKFDGEFLWWILYEGRTGERRRGYRHIRLKYPGKFVEIKNQRQLTKFMSMEKRKPKRGYAKND